MATKNGRPAVTRVKCQEKNMRPLILVSTVEDIKDLKVFPASCSPSFAHSSSKRAGWEYQPVATANSVRMIQDKFFKQYPQVHELLQTSLHQVPNIIVLILDANQN